MNAQRLSVLVVSALACLPSAVQAQGPWPTVNQPTFFSPVREFFTPRSYTTNYSQPVYTQSPTTPIIPGVPQCANGRCRQSFPNGQSSTPTQTYYQPNGSSNGNCVNGQCGPGNGISGGMNRWFNGNGTNGTLRPSLPNSSIGFRPLTPIQPNSTAPARGGQHNRLVPLDGGVDVPQGPMYRDRESMVPQNPGYSPNPLVRLQ